MTNSERITAHNARLAAMKETVAGLPEAGGGGDIPTCTVKIINEVADKGQRVNEIGYSYLAADGTINAYYSYSNSSEAEIIFENVLCNSILIITYSGYSWYGERFENGLTYIGGSCCTAPSTKGAVGILRLVDDY